MKKDLGTLGEIGCGALPALHWLANSSLLHHAVHGVHHDGGGGVDESRVGVVDVLAHHRGHHHGDVLLDRIALLPGHIVTVVRVAGPHLLAQGINIPDGGAVLLRYVLTLVHGLAVLLGNHRLVALLQGLVDHDHLEIHGVLQVPVHGAVGEELHLAFKLREGETHLPGDLLALLLQFSPANRRVHHSVVAR